MSDEKQAFKTREISVHECTTLDENTFSQHINCIFDYFSKQAPMFQYSQDNFYQNLRKEFKRRKTNYKIMECSHEFSHTEVYDQDSDSVQVLQCFDHVNKLSCAVLTRSLLHDWVMWFEYTCLTWSIRRTLRLPKECFLFSMSVSQRGVIRAHSYVIIFAYV